MWIYCHVCRSSQWMAFVATRTDSHGQRWERYRCPNCGHVREYAVS